MVWRKDGEEGIQQVALASRSHLRWRAVRGLSSGGKEIWVGDTQKQAPRTRRLVSLLGDCFVLGPRGTEGRASQGVCVLAPLASPETGDLAASGFAFVPIVPYV